MPATADHPAADHPLCFKCWTSIVGSVGEPDPKIAVHACCNCGQPTAAGLFVSGTYPLARCPLDR